MTHKAKAVAAVVAALGVAAVIAGGQIEDGYLQSAFLEIGAALLLAAPLFLLERLLEARVSRAQEAAATALRDVAEVREEARRTSERLDDLTSQTRAEVGSLATQDAELYDALRADVTANTLRNLLQRGQQLRAIAEAGIRVQVPLMFDRLRFAPAQDGEVLVAHEEIDGEVVSVLTWGVDERASQLLGRIAVELQRSNRFPGEDPFDGAEIVKELLRTVQVPIDARRRGSVLDLSPIVELCGDQWAITVNGLECLEYPYWIPARRLSEPDFRSHVMEKTWVKKDDLLMAWSAAEALHQRNPPQWLRDERGDGSQIAQSE